MKDSLKDITSNWEKAGPGEWPDCGCHYTNMDDGIHFCPMHKAASRMLEMLKNYDHVTPLEVRALVEEADV